MSASSSNALFANRLISPPASQREIDVDVLVAIVVLTAVLALALTRALRGRRGHPADQPGMDPSVTLSVLPRRRAVVTLDAEPDRSPAAADLVDQAVRDAFTLDGVDDVEVRRADGELLERRLRPEPGWTSMSTPAAPAAACAPTAKVVEPWE
jgi:hypothetical protein